MTRLSRSVLAQLPEGAAPDYDPAAHGVGILHLGAGAFHRAHQAAITDAALAASGGDWRIAGVSLRSADLAEALASQDGLFTLIERGAQGDRARVIGAIDRVIAARGAPEAVLGPMSDPAIRIVTLTVTEKAYGIDRGGPDADPAHPDVAADLESPAAPRGVLGLLVEGLRQRRAAGHAPFTVLCCDNLPENGALLRGGVVGFARRVDPDLADWIAAEVAFPSSMVDRITPAATEATLALAACLTGFEDAAAIETEPFCQWVIEDRFPQGRPDWAAGGAIFARDVAPYERMKLRMLNGAHSLIAYAGFISGHALVRDAMADPALAALARRQIAAAAATLDPLPGIDLAAYGDELVARFANPAIAHETYQIAMDGSQKLPQRIFGPACDAQLAEQELRPFAFATAAWARYCLGRGETGERHALRDPREAEIAAVVEAAGDDARALTAGLLRLPGLTPAELLDGAFEAQTAENLSNMLAQGMAAAIAREVA
ncbi:mannitol dehydrogenase family protein [Limimaricola sp. G21655-S1]|uniref:mannitol dehydrogenase family protein n=1 Tax=Limimaricola sp. G21655-S1 TaxID=3014768 RepID=UPI0022AF440F|nr:mannitol dehydrogenase family protein [Limimaricola sp. G21655-S1]MCZ4262071.1 mannitol dehydrogenase family protein [Limimaricola sp. G21655-S1]